MAASKWCDMTPAEQKAMAARTPVVARMMAFARERRVRNLSGRLAVERAAEPEGGSSTI